MCFLSLFFYFPHFLCDFFLQPSLQTIYSIVTLTFQKPSVVCFDESVRSSDGFVTSTDTVLNDYLMLKPNNLVEDKPIRAE